MSDTNHHHVTGEGPVQSDGVHFRGLIWFIAVLAITVLVSQGLMFGAFKWLAGYVKASDAPRSPLAVPASQLPPAPNLLYEASGSPAQNEPGHLREFREQQDKAIDGYHFDKATGVAKIPIDKAKELLLERGLPVRSLTPPGPGGAEKAPAKAEEKRNK